MLGQGAGEVRALIEVAVTAVSVLGGAMAYCSGFAAVRAMVESQPPEVLSQRINEGIAKGFVCGFPLATFALMIAMWS
jgi:hypothetical protein